MDAGTADYDKFVAYDSANAKLKYRTGSQLLSDINALEAGTNVNIGENYFEGKCFRSNSFDVAYNILNSNNAHITNKAATAYKGLVVQKLYSVGTANQTTAATKVLVQDGNEIKYRTPAEIRADLGLEAALMIGSANKEYVSTAFAITDVVGAVKEGTQRIANASTTNATAFFYLSGFPLARGGKKLYVDALEINLYAANSTNYIDAVRISGLTSSATTALFNDATNKTTVGKKTYTFTAIDLSVYDTIDVYVRYIVDTIGALKFEPPRLRIYYDD